MFQALLIDDPQIRQPAITRIQQLLDWAPEVELEEGLRRMIGALGRQPADL
jgi:nucleoside-diphosphate-sugar epimerase